MPDDKTKRGSADDKRIDKNDNSEIAYWSAKFGVTKQELLNAIENAGSPHGGKREKSVKELKA